MAATDEATGKFAVFELLNAQLREIYVGVADDAALNEVPLRLPVNAPLLHWDLQNTSPIRYVASELREKEARSFAEVYVKTSLPVGWRFVV